VHKPICYNYPVLLCSLPCHGDRLSSARFGSAGGLSQPRRETVDPKRNQKLKIKNNFPLTFYVFNFALLISYATPCDRASSTQLHYTIPTTQSTLSTTKICLSVLKKQLFPQKNTNGPIISPKITPKITKKKMGVCVMSQLAGIRDTRCETRAAS